jgi:hypothetical protein
MEHTKTIDYSWEHEVNPDNVSWRPGYRFCVRQMSESGGRRYYVHFRIGRDGALEWTGGVKARSETTKAVQAAYDRGRQP